MGIPAVPTEASNENFSVCASLLKSMQRWTCLTWATTVPFPLCRRHLFFKYQVAEFLWILDHLVLICFELPNRMPRLDALHTWILVAVLGHYRIWLFLRINLTRCAAVLGSGIPFAEACHDGRLLKGDQPQKAIMASFTAGKNHVASQTTWRHFLHQSRWARREQGRTCILPAIFWFVPPLEVSLRLMNGRQEGVSECLSEAEYYNTMCIRVIRLGDRNFEMDRNADQWRPET